MECSLAPWIKSCNQLLYRQLLHVICQETIRFMQCISCISKAGNLQVSHFVNRRSYSWYRNHIGQNHFDLSESVGWIGNFEAWFGLQIDRNICIQLCIQTFLTCLYSLCTQSKTLQNAFLEIIVSKKSAFSKK